MASNVFLLVRNACMMLHMSFRSSTVVFNGFMMFNICVVNRNGINSGTCHGVILQPPSPEIKQQNSKTTGQQQPLSNTLQEPQFLSTKQPHK
jgi:hypothetical protein|tara:strand:- start:286 stop:561 length:276 start_codon:yes stop_codon:yes gene_type:complete